MRYELKPRVAGKPHWTREEIEILKENYKSEEALIEKIPNHTPGAIRQKRTRLRLIHRSRSSPGGIGKWFKCETCGIPTYKSHLQLRFNHHFCSRECYTVFRRNNKNWRNVKRGGKVVNCDFCRKPVYKDPSSLQYTNHFCSRKCFSKFKIVPKVLVICEFCNKPFYKKRAEMKRAKYHHFCSPRCGYNYKTRENNPAWKGGTSFEPYGKEFNDELKELIRKRDNYICQRCSLHQDEQVRVLSIHHIDDDKTNNDPLNLISLCNKCHGEINLETKKWVPVFRSITHNL